MENKDFIGCPFCKKTPKLVGFCKGDEKGKKLYAYYCDNNDNGGHYVVVGWFDTEAEAREAWNNRC